MGNIPVFEPSLFGDEWQFLKQALDRREISGTSPVIRDFESAFGEWLGRSHVVAIANGTVSLHAACLALGLQPGEEVLVPSATIISDALAIVQCQAVPVFVDVDPHTWCVEVETLEQAVTSRTRGILAVDLFGHSPHWDKLTDFAKAKGLWILEDAAQGQGGFWKGQRLGTFGELASFSFYANKLISTGEGGALATDCPELASELLAIRNLGFDPDPTRRFLHTHLANNYRMSGMQAALGLAQLAHIQELEAGRKKIRDLYREALKQIPGLHFQTPHLENDPAFWMCALTLGERYSISIPELQMALKDLGIETRRFFYPLHRQPVLERYHSQKTMALQVSEQIFDRGFYLPSAPTLTPSDIDRITQSLAKVLGVRRFSSLKGSGHA